MATTRGGLLVTDRYRAQLLRLRSRAVLAADLGWARITPDSDFDQSGARARAITVPAVEAAQLAAARASAAYLTTFQIAELGETPSAPAFVAADYTTEGLRGVPAEDVYQRPVREVRIALAEGATMDEALGRGQARWRQLAVTGLTLAAAAAMVRMATTKVTGYNRVTQGVTCPLCVSAASHPYRSGQLMPIHPGCDCTVEPIFTTVRQPIERPAPRIRDDAAPVDIEIHDHGELGPVLYRAGDHFAEV